MSFDEQKKEEIEALNKLKIVDKYLAFFVRFSVILVFISLGVTFYFLNFTGLSFIESYNQRIPVINLTLGVLNIISLSLLFIFTYLSSANFFRSECIYARLLSTHPRFEKYKKIQSSRIQMCVSVIALNCLTAFNLFSKNLSLSICISILCILMFISSVIGFRQAHR